MEDIIIRKAEIEDITNLENIGSKEKYFIVDPELSGFWSDKELKNWILSDNDTILITEHNKEIIGFIMISHHVPTSKATLENIWVKKDFTPSTFETLSSIASTTSNVRSMIEP